MTQDIQYLNLNYELSELKHHYGDNIHLLKDPYLLTLLEKISSPKTTQPILTEYLSRAYQGLYSHIVASLLTTKNITSNTRMIDIQPEGVFQGDIIDQNIKAVCVDLARAGMIPSQLMYQELNFLLNAENVRQDHFYAARKVNEKNEVIGVDITGSKIGGDIEEAYVFIPDPMGATGGTICEAVSHYKEKVKGKAIRFISAHLIITPEYIQKIQSIHPDIEVFTIRLDRGLSSVNALNSIPGTFPKEEKGLNNNQYIVPGAGGVGELLNNSFV